MDTLVIRVSGRGPGGGPGLLDIEGFLGSSRLMTFITRLALAPPYHKSKETFAQAPFSLRVAHPRDGLSGKFLIFYFLTRNRVCCLPSQLNRIPFQRERGNSIHDAALL